MKENDYSGLSRELPASAIQDKQAFMNAVTASLPERELKELVIHGIVSLKMGDVPFPDAMIVIENMLNRIDKLRPEVGIKNYPWADAVKEQYDANP